MKKALLVSLLLVSIFLIGSVKEAGANDCTFYSCTGKYSCGEGIIEEWPDCVDIHYGDGHAALYGEWFMCELGGINLGSSNKNFVGVCESMSGLLGAAVNLRGRSMTIDFYEVENGGCSVQLRCTLGGCDIEF